MSEKFFIGRKKSDVRVVDLDTGEEVHRPEIAEQFLNTVDKAITAAGGTVVELPERDRSYLQIIDGEGAEVIQLFPHEK